MNKAAYNLRKFQTDNRLKTKVLAQKLNLPLKTVKKMLRDKHSFSQDERDRVAFLLGCTPASLQNEIHELINLRRQKIYGTDYSFLRYDVISYQSRKVNCVSAVLDFVFFLLFVLLLSLKKITFTADSGFLYFLGTAVWVTLAVCPLLFIVLPVLKIYFNRTYVVVLTSKLKAKDLDEAKGIVLGCLKRSVRKSVLPFSVSFLFEAAVGLYLLMTTLRSAAVNFFALLEMLAVIGSLVLTVLDFINCGMKYGSRVMA